MSLILEWPPLEEEESVVGKLVESKFIKFCLK